MGLTMSELTELENCVLGVIGRDGPCTRYHVMREFARSQTSRWSSTAGSIYPLIHRLSVRGLIAASAETTRPAIALTEAGRVAVRRWIVSATPDLGGPIDDPIRTRSFFLAAVDKVEEEQARALWRRLTIEALVACETRLGEFEEAGNRAEVHAMRGVRRQLVARLEWLDHDFE